MLNTQETTTILVIILVAFGLLAWGYNRAKGYGKLGKLAWLQSVSLMTPWLVFFGLFALGIYLNIVGILFLLVASIISYIYLGKKLRSEGQDVMLQNEAAQRIQEEEAKKDENKTPSLTTEFNDSSDNKNISDLIPIPDEDLQLIKGIFSIDTFFATETISYQEGAIFRGNLRGETEESYQKLSEKLKDSFGEKYRLFLVEGSEGKPVVIILPSSDDPQPTTLVQKNLALVLLVGTVFTTLEAASILLGFDLFNNWGRYIETLPIGLALWGIFIFHEVGHRVAAKRYDIKKSVPFFLPTWQIGSFGAITRFESLIPTRNALFDVALAGPACGGILSFILLIIGLVLSHDGSLFQVPTQFFQGSILVGSLAKVVLGEQLQNAIVDVHPLTVVGWLGLVVTALNLMPAGQLDGGRIIHLYWAVVILFLQRDLERPSLNELTEPDDTRAGWGLLALFLMLATLIPLSPALAGRLGIGG